MDLRSINVLVLAYLGDVVYELHIREYFVKQNIAKVNELQKIITNYVSARSQSMYLKKMMEANFIINEEVDIINRARNYKRSNHPKNTDIITYKYATGLEALIGYLYLNNDLKRIEEIINYILEGNK